MRFLLHAKRLPPQVTGRLAGKIVKAPPSNHAQVEIQNQFADRLSVRTSKAPSIQAWGQQCSSSCGCVVRFESSIDENQNVLDMKYHAKTLVTDNKFQPLSTSTNGSTKRPPRPLLKECTCTTLHTLARQIVHHCASETATDIHTTRPPWSKLRNMTEFQSHRSSLAFQHSVLREHSLDIADTHCFDVVEEAFTSMVRGYMPQKRVAGMSRGGKMRLPDTFTQQLRRQYAPNLSKLQTEDSALLENDHHRHLVDELHGEDKTDEQTTPEERRGAPVRRQRQRGYGVDQNVSMSTTRSAWNFLNLDVPKEADKGEFRRQRRRDTRFTSGSLFDLIDGTGEDEEDSVPRRREDQAPSSPMTLTWETYVDELCHQYDEGQGQEQLA